MKLETILWWNRTSLSTWWCSELWVLTSQNHIITWALSTGRSEAILKLCLHFDVNNTIPKQTQRSNLPIWYCSYRHSRFAIIAHTHTHTNIHLAGNEGIFYWTAGMFPYTCFTAHLRNPLGVQEEKLKTFNRFFFFFLTNTHTSQQIMNETAVWGVYLITTSLDRVQVGTLFSSRW